MVSFFVIGDPHFKTDNILECDRFISKLIPVIRERAPDYIVVLGDVLHNHEKLHVTPLNKAYEFIRELREIAHTYVLVGNHDAENNRIFLTDNHWMNGMKEWRNVSVVDTVQYLRLEEQDEFVVFCPYVPPGRFQEALSTCEVDWQLASCIFAHQEFAGCKMGAIVSVEGDQWGPAAPQVISGHIHSKQSVGSNIFYTGSAMQNAFGESEQNIVLSLTITQGDIEKEEIDLQLPRKKIVSINADKITDFVLPESDDKIRLTVSGDTEDFKALKKTSKYKELIGKGAKVVFKEKKKDKAKKEAVLVNRSEELVGKNFPEILSKIVTEKENPILYKYYQLIINGKEVEEDEIVFI